MILWLEMSLGLQNNNCKSQKIHFICTTFASTQEPFFIYTQALFHLHTSLISLARKYAYLICAYLIKSRKSKALICQVSDEGVVEEMEGLARAGEVD